MKKKRLFSRIFAAVLAVAIAAVTLITNSGAGLSVFADGEEAEATAEDNGSEGKYSVKIISPDVPNDGKKYSYNFYQIIAGEVEDDGGVNIIANPRWGKALGGEDFDKVPSNVPEGKPRGQMESEGTDVGVGYYPSSEVLLGALSGYMSCDQSTPGSSGSVVRSSLTDFAYKKYCEILKSYGVYKNDVWLTDATYNYFYAKFQYSLNGNGTYLVSGKTRDVKGLVELLNAGSSDGKLKTADLKAFAELLLNGVEVEVTTDITGTKEPYTYNFITTEQQATQAVSSNDGKTEYTVENLDPGYYLVACVDKDSKLSNDGYSTSMPIKPVSTMLILVGPANGGVTQIVGKNAYSVPTVTLDMYQKPVKLTKDIETGLGASYLSEGYDSSVTGIETIIKEDNWKNTGSFDYYNKTDRKEAILYRIGITLPQNFDKYSESGYFLAILDQYGHSGSINSNLNPSETERVVNVRPYVYVKSGTQYTLVGRCRGNMHDNVALATTGSNAVIETTSSNIESRLTNDNANSTYNKNDKLGSFANDLFCFGDLYNYTTGEGEDKKCIFSPGDTIYIYYPAILMKTNTFEKENYLLNANRIWAVYSNNPYAKKLSTANGNGTGNGYSHVVNGEVGVSPIAEANVNTYGVTLKVNGENNYTNGAKFALYKVVKEGERMTTEYAFVSSDNNNRNCHVVCWIDEKDLEVKDNGETIADALLNYKGNNRGYTFDSAYLATSADGIPAGTGMTIRGLAEGEYYLQELTISSKGIDGSFGDINDPDHDNLKKNHYELAKEPIKFIIENTYNDSVAGYLGVGDNQKTFISKLTVTFLQEKPERAIDTLIYNPKQGIDGEGNDIPVKNNSITTALSETSRATEDGRIEIQVYHKTINLIWLPETGGIGTTIFFIVGGMIVVMATVLIVTRFRIKRERL